MGILKKHPALFTGLGITILFLGLFFFRVDFLDTLELKSYDLMMKFRGDPGVSNEVVIVDIDDDSVEKLGRWPWPRSLLANIIHKINSGEPRVIGLNIILSEPEESNGLKELTKLKELFSTNILDKTGDTGSEFLQAISDAQTRLDNDKKLSQAIMESGKVVLPVFLGESHVFSEEMVETDPLLINQSIQNVRSPAGVYYPRSDDISLPIAQFLEHSKGIGHINLLYDMDGTARRERPVFEFHGLFIPSYTLKLAALYLNIPDNKIRANLGTAIFLGSLNIPTTKNTEILVSFKGTTGAFKKYSFFDVINDKVPTDVFKNKLVLVSPSAAGIMNPLSTPTDSTMPVGEFSANTVWSILNHNLIAQPNWGYPAQLIMIFLLGIVITFIMPRLKAMLAGMTFIILLILLVGGSSYLFIAKDMWVSTTYPVMQLLLGYIGAISLSFFTVETKKEQVEGESAESNRMLGLSFQSQGMLDMAFDKFRKVPVDNEVKDILYNLALDYERKRQLNKAAMVYEYIENHDKKFKDVAQKKTRLMQASETMVFGDGFAGGGSSSDDLLTTASDTRPTLGRYEIIKQLGKGAMGIVYLGQDPRINRTTAIKTFKFGDEFDPEDIQDLKAKFFREAESAGTLSHPNIVTIYDAGDEHDLAYIAMEFLEGEDLEKHVKKTNLLPMVRVIDYVADIANALDYAHQKGIVHRDIKPANIMLLDSGIVKITDFGIARITAISQTQTGIVKGTPYYMSPEQFSGQKVDGRSDIFSLGTMFFQLLTGELPFVGENPAALMNNIMNALHPNPKSINPKILTPIVTIINKALEKDRGNRYQRASQMSAHLKEVRKKIDAAMAKNKHK
ncbi:MAG: serine/threonine-protein kinase [Thermodesulfobacteriota bacterium]|nr:serine/threonine-protein kinase [Thermodesulfobacteriota bacterium]